MANRITTFRAYSRLQTTQNDASPPPIVIEHSQKIMPGSTDSLAIGDRVTDTDRDDAGPAVIISLPDETIAEHSINGQTVLDYNPEYSPDTPVAVVAFEDDLAAIDDWQEKSSDELEASVHDAGITTYSYPTSRLAPAIDRSTPRKVTLWFDGACEPVNPGGHATYGYVIKEDRTEVARDAGHIGQGDGMTNNVAEYTALIEALETAQNEVGATEITVHGDSQLVIRQLSGRYDVNSARLRPLWREARSLLSQFESVDLEWVPREQNEEADQLSKKAYEEQALADRLERARDEQPSISEQDHPRYVVKDKYEVDVDEKTCTCPDHDRREIKCKHIFAVELHLGRRN